MSSDCADVVNLARGLNFHLMFPTGNSWSFDRLENDCCTAYEIIVNPTGILCTNGRVTAVDWDGLGQFNGTVNSTAIPDSVNYIFLSGSGITGNMPKLDRITSLQYAYLDNNQFNGSVSALPDGFRYLRLENNNLQGEIPDFSNVHELQCIQLSTNRLTGQVPDLSMLQSLETVYLGANMLSGEFPLLPSSLQELGINYNLYTVVVPNLFHLANLRNIYLSNNQLSGTLKVFKPTLLRINDNLITDIAVYNKTLLTDCDLSRNALLNSINIQNLTNCLKSGFLVNQSL